MNVSTFSGAAGQDVVQWIARFKRIQGANGWSDERAAAYMKASLVGAAEAWLSAQDESRLESVEHIEKRLLEAFGPLNEGLVLMHQLQAKRQPADQPVEAYAAEVASLCRRLDVSMSPRERAAHLLNGILPALKEHLLSTLPGELDTTKLVTAARARQAALTTTQAASSTNNAAVGAATAIAATAASHQENSVDDKLQRIMNRLDSMADRLHKLEIKTRDDNEVDQRGRPYYQGTGNQSSARTQDYTNNQPYHHHDNRRQGQRDWRQNGRAPQPYGLHHQSSNAQQQQQYQYQPRDGLPRDNGGRHGNQYRHSNF